MLPTFASSRELSGRHAQERLEVAPPESVASGVRTNGLWNETPLRTYRIRRRGVRGDMIFQTGKYRGFDPTQERVDKVVPSGAAS